MPRTRKPSYLLHKPTGQARVRIDGRDHYLGAYGSPESRDRYERFVSEWLFRNSDATRAALTIGDLGLLYLRHVEQHYRKNGRVTSEVACVRVALRYLMDECRATKVAEFGPRLLKRIRQRMIEDGVVRVSLNRHIGRIRRMVKWGVAEEHVAPQILTGLQAVAGLQRGRTAAVESEPVRPVSEAHIDVVRPFVSRQIEALIDLQRLTGARPGEILGIRGFDLDRSGDVWEFVPESHKTEHHGRRRVIFIGPQAQAVLTPFLKSDPQAYLFSPREARAEFEARRRKSPAVLTSPSSSPAGPSLRWRPGAHYNEHAYRTAIHRGCDRAGIPRWNPNQLRHNAATLLRREFGLEAARTILGHASAVTTEIYAEADHERARTIIRSVG